MINSLTLNKILSIGVFVFILVISFILLIDSSSSPNTEIEIAAAPVQASIAPSTQSPVILIDKRPQSIFSPNNLLESLEIQISKPTEVPTETPTPKPTPTPTATPPAKETPVISRDGLDKLYSYKITAKSSAYTNGEDKWGNQVVWSGGSTTLGYYPFLNTPGLPSKVDLKNLYNNFLDNHKNQWGYKKGELYTRWGVIAVDPRIIPLGSAVYIKSLTPGIPDYGYAIAVDVGGFINRNDYSKIQNGVYNDLIAVDLWMETKTQCVNYGIRQVEIYILEDQTIDIFAYRNSIY